jgi:large subunit ribosomal protein LP1
MSSTDELACVYAALILQDDEVAITAEKLQTILKAANVEVEPYWPGLFSKALENLDIKALITNVGSGVGAAAPAAPALSAQQGGGAPQTEAKEDKKKAKEPESEEEEDDDMGFGLFD